MCVCVCSNCLSMSVCAPKGSFEQHAAQHKLLLWPTSLDTMIQGCPMVHVTDTTGAPCVSCPILLNSLCLPWSYIIIITPPMLRGVAVRNDTPERATCLWCADTHSLSGKTANKDTYSDANTDTDKDADTHTHTGSESRGRGGGGGGIARKKKMESFSGNKQDKKRTSLENDVDPATWSNLARSGPVFFCCCFPNSNMKLLTLRITDTMRFHIGI